MVHTSDLGEPMWERFGSEHSRNATIGFDSAISDYRADQVAPDKTVAMITFLQAYNYTGLDKDKRELAFNLVESRKDSWRYNIEVGVMDEDGQFVSYMGSRARPMPHDKSLAEVAEEEVILMKDGVSLFLNGEFHRGSKE